MATDAASNADTIVLIHGLWLTPLCWEKWVDHYQSKGFNVLAPSWPGMEGEIEEVRHNTTPYERLGIKEIADHYERIIRELDRPPIIMGHSFGGLITQVLLDRGLGAAGVAISPAPIKGILVLPFSALKVASVALKNPANRNKAVPLTPDEFRYGFGNLLSVEDSQRAYDRLARDASFSRPPFRMSPRAPRLRCTPRTANGRRCSCRPTARTTPFPRA
jgi:pimeloyl-ACP methyl ester carboxylesterase